MLVPLLVCIGVAVSASIVGFGFGAEIGRNAMRASLQKERDGLWDSLQTMTTDRDRWRSGYLDARQRLTDIRQCADKINALLGDTGGVCS